MLERIKHLNSELGFHGVYLTMCMLGYDYARHPD